MGLKCGNSINYSLINLNMDQLMRLARYRMDRRASSSSGNRLPVIDMDASWIIRRCNLQPSMRLNYLFGMCLAFISEGCCITIICDGDVRHHTKRSTTKRTADLHQESIEFHHLKCILSCLTKRIMTEDR